MHKLEVQRAINDWRIQNEHVQKQLDDKVDRLKNEFTDVEVALNYDVDNLEKKFESVPKVCVCVCVCVYMSVCLGIYVFMLQ
jgi:hypothetical protein